MADITEVEYIWKNGEIVPWAEATTHILSHSLHYGSGVFEGIRCYQNPETKKSYVFRLRDHMERLHRSCKIALIDLPYSVDELCEATVELIRKNNLPSCYIRPIVYRGYGVMGVDPTGAPTDVAIAAWPWDSYLGADALENGVAVGVSSWRQRSNNAIPPAVKATASYMNSILAKLEAKQHGYAEAIMLNEAGLVCEGTGENLFVVRDGVLSTPPLSDGLLEGITRDTVLCLADDSGDPGHRGEPDALRPLRGRRGVHDRLGRRAHAHRQRGRPRGGQAGRDHARPAGALLRRGLRQDRGLRRLGDRGLEVHRPAGRRNRRRCGKDACCLDRILTYDSTLRDGEQSEGIALSLEDKLRIVERLDAFGMDFIEGGFPASNPKDIAFFERVRAMPLKHASIAAFGSTCKKGVAAADDQGLADLVGSGAPAVTIVGKTWDEQVTRALLTTLDENLRMIRESVAYLKAQGLRVVFDAEHFFDGYKANPDFALACVRAASEAGADSIDLCETNGGALPHEVEEIVRTVAEALPGQQLGIHCHDDSGCAVANTLAAVRAGATQVQGTVNGFGERVGNADLLTVIADLELKMGCTCVGAENLRQLTGVSQFVAATCNLSVPTHHPYTGASAFAHKGGLHASAIARFPEAYEHARARKRGQHAAHARERARR